MTSRNKTFRLPERLAARAETKAHREARSLNAVVERLLEEWVGGEGTSAIDAIDAVVRQARERRGGLPAEPAPSFDREALHER